MADYNINAITRRVVYTGSAGLGPYAFSFEVIADADVGVYFNQTLLTLASDYTVTVNANGTGSVNIITGGNVPSTPTATDTVIIIGARDIERTTDFVTAGDLLASSLNEQLDSNIIFEQQIDERVDRSIKFPVYDSFTGDNVLPAAAARADKILKFDSSGNIGVETASALFGGAVVGANFVNNTFTGDGSQTAFTTTVEAGSKNNAQVYIDGVYQLKSSFSVSGTTLTFTEAPPLNSQIEVIIGKAIDTLDADSGNINYNQGGTGAQTRTVENKLQEFVSVKDFGAVGDGVADDTAAIQAAIDSGLSLIFPEGNYSATGLTQSTDGQKFIGNGKVQITRSSGGALFTSTGRNVSFSNIEFNGASLGSGNLVICSGDIVTFTNCAARTNSGHALWCKGSSNIIQGTNDIYYSAGVTNFNDAAIALGQSGSPVNYNIVSNIHTSTSNYGLFLIEAGTTKINSCQLGSVDTSDGGAYITNCRIVGDLIMGGNTFVDVCTISGDVTIGDGVATQGALGFGPNITMQSGATITLNKMREAHVSIAHLGNTGVTIVDNVTGDATDIGNSIFTPPIAFTPTWSATSVNPAIGNGTLTGFYVRNGATIDVTVELVTGSTTTYGTGTYFFTLPAPTKTVFGGNAFGEDVGTQYIFGACFGGSDFGDAFRIVDQTSNNQWGTTVPMTWATGDKLRAYVSYIVDNT